MNNNFPPLAPGSTIGILGGGQLGRMLALAAARLGMHSHIFCPDPLSPAFDVTALKTIAEYDDFVALEKFAAALDVVTYEFENVPAQTAQFIASHTILAPGARALSIAQDRLAEKQFLHHNQIAIAPFAPVLNDGDFVAALEKIGTPSVLKTTRLGYDGKGQRMIKSPGEAQMAFAALSGQQLVLEAFIPFEMEISVIVARNMSGDIKTYDPAQNVHVHHILHTSSVPAALDEPTLDAARSIAVTIVEALDYAGVLAVEFFVVNDNGTRTLLVNEIAPRVHNSGHWSQSVCLVDQFEQHIRAICNWPLASTKRMGDVIMTNLIGDQINALPATLKTNQQPHIYGKREIRPGRKMGHINTIIRPEDEKQC
ncbi:N5-carboxyaminoimidazole ribonucleotide synthase [hydrothermal vent metagenome]|uniref:N5-carboxyaminoimidazole ribonucleotide synthase n=1 Tax=hydrothermal vent metagenome TaxID=652676 RepID=A0A3B0TR08_9ZZZZ